MNASPPSLQTAAPASRGTAMLLFQLGERRLALPPAYAAAVIPFRAPQPVPHRRNSTFLGLIAFAGDIIPCCSLNPLLGDAGMPHTGTARMLVLQERPGERWALPVDAVLGVRCGEYADTPPAPDAGSSFLGAAFHDEEAQRATTLSVEAVFAHWHRALA